MTVADLVLGLSLLLLILAIGGAIADRPLPPSGAVSSRPGGRYLHVRRGRR